MIKNKIKQLIVATGNTQSSVSEKMETSIQNFSNKLNKDTFRIVDAIKIAKATDTTLAYLDRSGNIIVKFTDEDIRDA